MSICVCIYNTFWIKIDSIFFLNISKFSMFFLTFVMLFFSTFVSTIVCTNNFLKFENINNNYLLINLFAFMIFYPFYRWSVVGLSKLWICFDHLSLVHNLALYVFLIMLVVESRAGLLAAVCKPRALDLLMRADSSKNNDWEEISFFHASKWKSMLSRVIL